MLRTLVGGLEYWTFARFIVLTVFVGIGLTVAVAFTNCDNVVLKVKPPVQTTLSSVRESLICTEVPQGPDVKARVLFVVDMSGSNFEGNDGRGIGTDSDKAYRVGSIRRFVNSHANNKKIGYGLIGFNTSAAFPILADASSRPVFSSDLAVVDQALENLRTAVDSGATPYRSAMGVIQQAIQIDQGAIANPSEMPYVVVFISDGAPTDYGSPVNQGTALADTAAVVSSAARVSVSTVYYGPQQNQLDANAIELLTKMAEQGGGVFMNTNISGREKALDEVVPLLQLIPRVIKRFMVKNITSAPCDDGTMGVDSDSDGLCDKDEEAYNETFARDVVMGPRMNGFVFNPTSRNSFGNNYSDYFNFLAIRYGQFFDAGCTGVVNSSYDLLSDCEKKFIESKNPSGPTLAWTQAMGTHGDGANFDSDGDGFLDSIEMIYGRNQSYVLDYSSPSSLMNKYRVDEILMQHLNPASPATGSPYDGLFEFKETQPDGRNCYTYKQTNLPLYRTLRLPGENSVGNPELAHGVFENVIFAYYIEVPVNDPNNVGVLHTNYRRMTYGKASPINYSSEDFSAHRVSGTLVELGTQKP